MNPSDAIKRLLASGKTEAAIGQDMHVQQSTINKIKRGVVPNWELGQRLINAAANLDEDGAPLDRTMAANDAAESDEDQNAAAVTGGRGTASTDAVRHELPPLKAAA